MKPFPIAKPVPIQKIDYLSNENNTLSIKREDLIHPLLSGNKFWKLKYNFQEALKLNKKGFITFGGAFSNHLYAVAALGSISKMKTIGIVRGEELKDKWQENPTLSFCHKMGMQFYFIDRNGYRLKEESDTVQKIIAQHKDLYLIPEGGTNIHALKGTQEILTEETHAYDFIACPIGTGGTLAGLSLKAQENQNILGFSVLKNGDFLTNEIKKFSSRENFNVILPFHFGGYGKFNTELICFIEDFYLKTQIKLEPIYSAKMMFGLQNLIQDNYFPPNSRILAIHTGGLQSLNHLSQIQFKSKND